MREKEKSIESYQRGKKEYGKDYPEIKFPEDVCECGHIRGMHIFGKTARPGYSRVNPRAYFSGDMCNMGGCGGMVCHGFVLSFESTVESARREGKNRREVLDSSSSDDEVEGTGEAAESRNREV